MQTKRLHSDRNVIICNGKTIENVKRFATLFTVFLKETSKLTEAYVLDYFVENHWNKLSSQWQETLRDFDVEDLKVFLNSEEQIRYRKPWPLSLLAFRACAFTLSISRKSVNSTKPVEHFLQETFDNQSIKFVADTSKDSRWSSPEKEFKNISGQHKKIPEFCRRHVKRKKQHEIFRLAELTDTVRKNCGVENVVDIGSGQGHLSRILAFCYKFNVATVESESCHVTGAVNFDKQAYTRLKKQQTYVQNSGTPTLSESITNEEMLPHHLQDTMSLASPKEFLKCVSEKAWPELCLNEYLPPLSLVGLHTCGDLSAMMFKAFVECEQPQALLSVGCCYMKLNSTLDGYPLSSYIKSLPNHKLSYEAREVACHALEMHIERLKENASTLKIHCYRATLEKCIVHFFPESKRMSLKGVKHADQMEFHEYAEKALVKASLEIPLEFLKSSDVLSCLKEWKKVLIFYALRLIIAPVVESLILFDRIIYLYEKGCPSCLLPIFDPSMSPRNHVIVSSKLPLKDC